MTPTIHEYEIEVTNLTNSHSFEIQSSTGFLGKTFTILDAQGEKTEIYHPHYRLRNYYHLYDKNGYQATSRKISSLFEFLVGFMLAPTVIALFVFTPYALEQEEKGYYIWDNHDITLGYIAGQAITGYPGSSLVVRDPDDEIITRAQYTTDQQSVVFKDKEGAVLLQANQNPSKTWKINILSNKIDPKVGYFIGAALMEL